MSVVTLAKHRRVAAQKKDEVWVYATARAHSSARSPLTLHQNTLRRLYRNSIEQT
jgi:hypothetical protein